MSSLRNAVKRKTHKERQQPAARRHLGLLEKHKDYKERATDFHKKERALRTLKRKAEERNPDEFYFAMEMGRTRSSVHIAESAQANKYSAEQLRLMKTQDVKYVALKAQAEARKVERLKSSLHCIGAVSLHDDGRSNRHTIFVDSADEVDAFSPEEHFDTPSQLLGRTFNRPRRAQLADSHLVSSREEPKRVEKWSASAYKGLAERQERQKQLAGVVEGLYLKKELMGKGTKRKRTEIVSEDGVRKPVYKWKRERKK